jgi:hypothetical protein
MDYVLSTTTSTFPKRSGPMDAQVQVEVQDTIWRRDLLGSDPAKKGIYMGEVGFGVHPDRVVQCFQD